MLFRSTLPSKKVGKVRLFLRWDIEQGQSVTPPDDLAPRLADWREANGRSLASLEEPLGVSRETIRRFETGEMKTIPVVVYKRILALLEGEA